MLVRVLFDALSTMQAIEVYKLMFTPASDIGVQLLEYASSNGNIIVLIILSAIITFGFKNTTEIAENFEPKARYAVFAAALMAVSLFCMGQVLNFLYFQF